MRNDISVLVPPPPKITTNLMSKLTAEPEGYAECYPGLQEMDDAIEDSDDEVDFIDDPDVATLQVCVCFCSKKGWNSLLTQVLNISLLCYS